MSDGTKVSIVDHTGIEWFFSPGCSVTETMNLGLLESGRMAGQENYLTIMPTDFSHVIRIDATILTYSDEESNGTTTYPFFDPYAFHMYVMLNTTDKNKHTLYWRGYTFGGLVKSVTFTQRPGEGNLVDMSLTFAVGKIAGVDT
jgi:hypothetical protein